MSRSYGCMSIAANALQSAICIPLNSAGMVLPLVSHMEIIKQNLEVNN